MAVEQGLDDGQQFVGEGKAESPLTPEAPVLVDGIWRFRPEVIGRGPSGFYPDKIVAETTRVQALNEIIATLTDGIQDQTLREETHRKLHDLVIYNAYGRVFPIPNVAGDLVAAPEDAENPLFTNTIMMVKVGGRLAVIGGFTDIGESPTQTVKREGLEEAHFSDTPEDALTHFVGLGQESKLGRDPRPLVIISAIAGAVAQVNPDKLRAGDDAEKVIILKLINDDGTLNTDIFRGVDGEGNHIVHKDVFGNEFTHDGLRADHIVILQKAYTFWKQYGRPNGLSLAQTFKRMSAMIDQDWFDGATPHAPEKPYETLKIENEGKVMLTENVEFLRKKAKEVFLQANLNDEQAEQKANILAIRAVGKDILPLFPQNPVTIDCVMTDENHPDEIWVHELPDGRRSLPGTFHSPEPDSQITDLGLAATQIVLDKYGTHFRIMGEGMAIGGTVVTGESADPRHPRITFPFWGIRPSASRLEASNRLPKGSKLVLMPLWKDKQAGIPSDEIMGAEWAYNHNVEILSQFLMMLRTLDPAGTRTAYNILVTGEPTQPPIAPPDKPKTNPMYAPE